MTPQEALALFDSRPAVPIDMLSGFWRGQTLPTGHRLDGLLVASGWLGKRFHTPEDVDPLIHQGLFGTYRLNPALAMMGPAMALRLDLWPGVRPAFRVAGRMLATRKPRARLRMVEHRGLISAAMIYDQRPIIDHFRRLGPDRVLGLMDRRGDGAPCFFVLSQVTQAGDLAL